MTSKPLAVFAIAHPWMQQMSRQACPPNFALEFVDPQDEAAVREAFPRADFLVAGALNAQQIGWLARCRLVQMPGVGYNSVDTGALAAQNIPLATTPEGTVIGVAEHTILLILGLYKQIIQIHETMRQGKFENEDWRATSHFLYRKTVAIVGLGRIGQRVAQLAKAFESNLIYYDVYRPARDLEQALGVSFVPFDELLPQADILTVHTPLTPETTGLFGAAQFARMQAGALFINTSRGGTYDMDALYESLRNGHLGGAGLDVFNPEPPPPDHPILQLPNVICTPHIATGTVEAHEFKAKAQFDNFQRVLNGEQPRNLVVALQSE